MLAERSRAADLVLVDLTVESDALLQWVEKAKAGGAFPRVVGFLPHIEKELAHRAQAAGVDHVMTRSKFVAALPEILANQWIPSENRKKNLATRSQMARDSDPA